MAASLASSIASARRPRRASTSRRRRAWMSSARGPSARSVEVPPRCRSADVGTEHASGRLSRALQAELHVLVEQERVRVEGPEPAQQVGAGREAGGDRPADRRAPVAAPGLVAASQRSRADSGRGTSAGTRASSRAGQRDVRCPGRCRRHSAAAAPGAPLRCRQLRREPAEAVVEQLDVGVHQRRDRLAHQLEARVAAGAEAGDCRRDPPPRRPSSRASPAPPSLEPLSTTITRGRGSSWRSTESSSAGQLGLASRGSP